MTFYRHLWQSRFCKTNNMYTCHTIIWFVGYNNIASIGHAWLMCMYIPNCLECMCVKIVNMCLLTLSVCHFASSHAVVCRSLSFSCMSWSSPPPLWSPPALYMTPCMIKYHISHVSGALSHTEFLERNDIDKATWNKELKPYAIPHTSPFVLNGAWALMNSILERINKKLDDPFSIFIQ